MTSIRDRVMALLTALGIASGPAVGASTAAPATRDAAEAAIRALLRAQPPGPDLEGVIDIDESGYSPDVTVGPAPRKRPDTRDWPPYEFFDAVDALRKAAAAGPEGPWYHCRIHLRRHGDIAFEYFHESTPFRSPRELVPDVAGYVPLFVYRRRFDPELLAELSDFEVNTGLDRNVDHRLRNSLPVSDAMHELYWTQDWEGSVKNGGFEQYFALGHPLAIHQRVLAGLRRIGADTAADLFVESVATWAHVDPDVEALRVALGIAAIPHRETTDVASRFYTLDPSLDTLRARYLRAHPDVLPPP